MRKERYVHALVSDHFDAFYSKMWCFALQVVPAGSGAGVDVTSSIDVSVLDDEDDENLLTAE